MADKTITELPSITAYNDAAVIPVDSGVQTFKMSKAKMAQGMQKWAAGYDAVVGSADYCTHANLAAALADAALTTNVRVLVTTSQTLAATIAMSKAGWRVFGLPGVTFTAGVATTAITVTAERCEIRGLKFSGFTTGVFLSTGGGYARIADNYFVSTVTSVDDSGVVGVSGSIYGNIEE